MEFITWFIADRARDSLSDLCSSIGHSPIGLMKHVQHVERHPFELGYIKIGASDWP